MATIAAIVTMNKQAAVFLKKKDEATLPLCTEITISKGQQDLNADMGKVSEST